MFDIIPTNDQTWLICGGRDFADQRMFSDAMGDLIRLKGMPSKVIHGNYGRADKMGDEWANLHAIPVQRFDPDWDRHGKAAGPIRNQEMANSKPHFVIAFPGGRGTTDMIMKARGANIDVAEIKEKQHDTCT